MMGASSAGIVMTTVSHAVAIIPARMRSSRFPGKPLVEILGLPMIEHVRRRVRLCTGLADVVVATCDTEIRDVVESCGGTVIMTSSKHVRCTERIAEAAGHLVCDFVINVQGDEPTVRPEVVDLATMPLQAEPDLLATCIVYPMGREDEFHDVNVVKVVLSQNDSVLYLSRSPIPSSASNGCYKQSGIMGFRKDVLHEYAILSPTPLEKAESVDMLRLLEHDYRIKAVMSKEEAHGVDVPADVAKVERIIRSDRRQSQLHEEITRR